MGPGLLRGGIVLVCGEWAVCYLVNAGAVLIKWQLLSGPIRKNKTPVVQGFTVWAAAHILPGDSSREQKQHHLNVIMAPSEGVRYLRLQK